MRAIDNQHQKFAAYGKFLVLVAALETYGRERRGGRKEEKRRKKGKREGKRKGREGGREE